MRAYADSRFLESIHKKLRDDDEGIFLLFLRYLSEKIGIHLPRSCIVF